MSLRKSPTLTPALLTARREYAQKSTGPRTVQGKAQVDEMWLALIRRGDRLAGSRRDTQESGKVKEKKVVNDV